MSESASVTVVSIVGDAYAQPICDLLSRLFAPNRKSWRNAVKVSSVENGYAVSVCVLAVLCLESYIMRARYRSTSFKTSGRDRSALTFFRQRFPNYHSHDQLSEVFVLRDAIAHNHLWEIEYSSVPEQEPRIQRAHLDNVSGDAKYREHVDRVRHRTKRLGLRVIPFQVGRKDAVSVLAQLFQALHHMEADSIDICQISNTSVHYAKRRMLIGDVIRHVRKWRVKSSA